MQILNPLRGRSANRSISIILFFAALALFIFLNADRPAYTSYFPHLADAFLRGRLGLLDAPSWMNELVPGSNGQLYVVYPPAPAVLLMPFVAVFGPQFRQEYASMALGALNVVLVFHMLIATKISTRGAVAIALTYAFGSVTWYAPSIGTAWHFAHVVSLFAMLCAIRSCQRDSSLWVIGFFFALAGLSRLPMLAAAPFFCCLHCCEVKPRGFTNTIHRACSGGIHGTPQAFGKFHRKHCTLLRPCPYELLNVWAIQRR